MIIQPLSIQYRPESFIEVVGQDKAIARLTAIESRAGFGGRAFWFSGESGTGKTTLANIIGRSIASDICIDELDASALTAARIREIESNCQTYGMGAKNGRAFIVNESHGLRRDAIKQLLTTLERIPSHVVWIFTTTNDGMETIDDIDAKPLFSRCFTIKLAQRGLAQIFAEHARSIALREKLTTSDVPASRFLSCVKENRNNLRAVLMAVESGVFL